MVKHNRLCSFHLKLKIFEIFEKNKKKKLLKQILQKSNLDSGLSLSGFFVYFLILIIERRLYFIRFMKEILFIELIISQNKLELILSLIKLFIRSLLCRKKRDYISNRVIYYLFIF